MPKNKSYYKCYGCQESTCLVKADLFSIREVCIIITSLSTAVQIKCTSDVKSCE